MDEVLLIDGPCAATRIAWPALGYAPARHAFVDVDVDDQAHDVGAVLHAVYERDGAIARFVGVRRRYAAAMSATRAARTSSSAA